MLYPMKIPSFAVFGSFRMLPNGAGFRNHPQDGDTMTDIVFNSTMVKYGEPSAMIKDLKKIHGDDHLENTFISGSIPIATCGCPRARSRGRSLWPARALIMEVVGTCPMQIMQCHHPTIGIPTEKIIQTKLRVIQGSLSAWLAWFCLLVPKRMFSESWILQIKPSAKALKSF